MNDYNDTIELVRRFLRVDTSNPPGNEEKAVLLLEDILKQEEIEYRIFRPAPDRANILARIQGKSKNGPVILLSHIDVVPAVPEEWDADPFGAELIDGFIYGRGAIDMKVQAICQLLSFVRYFKSGVVPERDIIYLATCDEEVGGKYGVEYMLEQVPELKSASFVLSEGGFIIEEDGRIHAQISVTEKQLSQFMISATGTGGHGSLPHGDNANEKIIDACKRIMSYKWPLKQSPVAAGYINGLLRGRKVNGYRFIKLDDALKNERFRQYVESVPVYNAILRNTVTPTILRGGEKVNVIPAESAAYFDARLLPTEKRETFFKKIRRLAGKDVTVVPVTSGSSDPLSSGYETHHFRGIRAIVRELNGDIPVLPFVMNGATDLRYFRNHGIPAYGFFPITLSRDELSRMHGKNERISLENVIQGLEGTYELTKFLGSV